MRTVRAQLMAGAGGMIALLGVVAIGNIHHGLAELLRGELTLRGLAVGEMVATAGEQLILTGDDFALHRLLRDAVDGQPDASYAYVRDARGRVAAHSFPGGFPRGLAAAHPGPPRRGMRLLDTPEQGRIQDVAVPILEGRLGAVHIGMRESRVRGRIAALVGGWGAAAVLLLTGGLAAAHWLTGRFAARIDRLIRLTEAVGRGDFAAPEPDTGGDEISKLTDAFGKMTRELKTTQGELIRAGKLAAVGELASGVAHEINNPLNTIRVCSQALLSRAEDPALRAEAAFEDFPEYLAAIEEETLRCKRITDGLLDFARRRDPSRAPLFLDEVVQGALPLAGLRLGAASGAVELEDAALRPRVLGDRDQLHQVFVNLLINAHDHNRPGGRIRIAWEVSGGRVAALVRDEGPGIPVESRERVFEPFFTTKKPGRGTGLGLAICRRIVESHGGRIVAGDAPGGGAELRVELPAAEA